jgi:Cytochrome oxidase complex assembly protein 1/zinc-ribbon domain
VFCPHCGTQTAPESRFCRQCGAAMPVVTSSASAAVSLPGQSGRRSMSWAETHWKRLVALLLFLAVLGVAALLGIVSLGMSFVRNSDVAEEAIARARSSQAVTQRLGVPIKEARFVSGSINVSPGSGSADLALPISGPKGSGTLYVTARKIAGAWQYSLIQLNVEGSGDKIDVLNADLPSGAVPRTPEPPPSSATPSQF